MISRGKNIPKVMFLCQKSTVMTSKLIFASILMTLLTACAGEQQHAAAPTASRPEYAIVLHGGAGTITKANMTPEKEKTYIEALNTAIGIGDSILKNGGTSLDAVTQTIAWLEDCPLFNAGKGAVFTNAATNELDASIMEGSQQMAGAVGGVTTVKNPIKLARAVMERSQHVFLTGKGADQFAREQKLDIVDPSYFHTPERWEGLQKAKHEEDRLQRSSKTLKYGTVGVAALDKHGNLAAGTSTGGMTNKRWNRLGDSPVIGAGTYADNATCAVSCTGHGEYFIRYTVARSIAALMEYKGLSLQAAADEIVMKKLVEKGGEGGIIAVDKSGNIAMVFNSEGMYRASATPGNREVKIYK